MRKEMRIPLIVFIITLIICSYAIADDTRTSGLFTYKLKGNGTITIVDFDWANNSGDIYIPTMLDGYNLTGIGDKAFAQTYGKAEKNPTCSVNIPNTITSIGDFAFENANITFVNIPQSVTHIGKNPFLRCVSLSQISVDPNNTTFASIDGVLYHKGNKALISYPLAAVAKKVPSGIIEISDYACVGVSWRTDYFPDTLKKIGAFAFQNTSIEVLADLLPESVTEIGEYAFLDAECVILSQFYSTKEEKTLLGKNNKSKTVIPQGKPTFEDLDKIFADKYGNSIEWQGVLLFGQNVTTLGRGAFKGLFIDRERKDYTPYNPRILLVCLGEVPGSEKKASVKVIPKEAFDGMKVYIPYSSFEDHGYHKGMYVYLPSELDAIEENAFADVSVVRLKDNHIGMVGKHAFRGAKANGRMMIDACDTYGFADASGDPMVVTLTGSSIPAHAFENAKCTLLIQGDEIEKIEDYAFYNSNVILPNKVSESGTTSKIIQIKKIGDHTFDNAKLSRFILIDGLNEIGNNAFINNHDLQEITLPNGISSIGDNAFDKTVITLIVTKGSYSEFWAQENGYSYHYEGEDNNNTDWLNN